VNAVLAAGRITGLVAVTAVVGVIMVVEVVETLWSRHQDDLFPVPDLWPDPY
jgi:hypothetical protein